MNRWALLVAWVTLVTVTVVGTVQTERLIQANRAAIEANYDQIKNAQRRTCAIGEMVWELGNIYVAGEYFSRRAAERERRLLSKLFKDVCADYVPGYAS